MNFLYTTRPFHAPHQYVSRIICKEKEIPRWIAIEIIGNKSPYAHSLGDQYSLRFLENSCKCPVVTAPKKIGRA